MIFVLFFGILSTSCDDRMSAKELSEVVQEKYLSRYTNPDQVDILKNLNLVKTDKNLYSGKMDYLSSYGDKTTIILSVYYDGIDIKWDFEFEKEQEKEQKQEQKQTDTRKQRIAFRGEECEDYLESLEGVFGGMFSFLCPIYPLRNGEKIQWEDKTNYGSISHEVFFILTLVDTQFPRLEAWINGTNPKITKCNILVPLTAKLPVRENDVTFLAKEYNLPQDIIDEITRGINRVFDYCSKFGTYDVSDTYDDPLFRGIQSYLQRYCFVSDDKNYDDNPFTVQINHDDDYYLYLTKVKGVSVRRK